MFNNKNQYVFIGILLIIGSLFFSDYFFVSAANSSQNIIIRVISYTPTPTPSPPGGGGAVLPRPLPPKPRPTPPPKFLKTADFNRDIKVNIVDLSIMLFYFDKSGSLIQPYDLNDDGKLDLIDISIFLYYWTG